MSHLNDELFEVSGMVKMKGCLEAFLYALMHDELAAGVVQQLVDNATLFDERGYTNGYLAQYAKFLADQLRKED